MNDSTNQPRQPYAAQWTMLVLVLMALGGIIVHYLVMDFTQTRDQERERLRTQARVVEINLGRQLEAAYRVLLSLRKEWKVWRADPAQLRETASLRFKVLNSAMPGVRTINLLDARGTIIASNRGDLIDANFAHREYFQDARDDPNPDTLHLSQPFSSALKVFIMSLTLRLVGPDGNFAGIVTASLDPEYFRTLMESVLYAPGMWSYIAHGDGLLFVLVPEQEGMSGKLLTGPQTFFARHLKSGRVENVESGMVYATGDERMIATRTIRPVSLPMDKPLVFAITRKIDDIYSPWWRELRVQGGLFGFLVLVSTLGLLKYQRGQRRLAQQAVEAAFQVQESAETLDRFFTLALDLLCIADITGNFLRLNPTWTRTLGYELAELEGRRFLDLVHPEDLAATMEALGTLAEGSEVRSFVNRYRCKDGSWRWIEWHSVPYRRYFIYAAARDVTEQRRNEAELIQAKEQAEAATRAKTNFLTTISHEIRTPMNVVLGLSEVLLETPLNPEQRQYVETMHHSGGALLGIINDVLDLSRIEAGRFILAVAPFSPCKVVEETTHLMQLAAVDKGLKVTAEIVPATPELVTGDEVRLRQVLLNLIGNAVKFTHRGGVVVSLELDPAQPATLRFRVADTGIGIATEQQDMIFDRFIQADVGITRRYGGTGLGLAISRQMVELMGGTMGVESREGEGSTFFFTLPVTTGSHEGSARVEEPALPDASIRLRVLMAEDSPDNQLLFQAYFKDTPHRLTLVGDGAAAVARVQSGEFDLVLMDVQMPEMDGYTATRLIRNWERESGRRSIPIIALSAHAMEGELERSRAAGCDGYLSKPIKKQQLLEALQQVAGSQQPAG